jgi:hypothetical protein
MLRCLSSSDARPHHPTRCATRDTDISVLDGSDPDPPRLVQGFLASYHSPKVLNTIHVHNGLIAYVCNVDIHVSLIDDGLFNEARLLCWRLRE